MTQEELEAKISAIEERNALLERSNAELSARFAPTTDPDLAYKPKSWTELKEREEATAKQIAMDVLKEAEEAKEAERRKQEDLVKEYNKKIDDTLGKLKEEGVLGDEKEQESRTSQIIQSLNRMIASGAGFSDVEGSIRLEASRMKSAWDAGMQYDTASHTFVPSGRTPSPTRDATVSSSAARPVSDGKSGGPIDLKGVRGDLDVALARWKATNGKA